MNLFQIYRNLILPLIILNIAIEIYFLLPACLAEQTAHFLLDGRRNEACTVAILIIIGTTMLADEPLAHEWLYATRHVGIEDMHHAFCKLYLL